MIKADFLKQLDKFSLVVRKNVSSSFIGERRSFSTGTGLIFRDYASYSFGDDFKSIDWKAYAKTEKLYVKRYDEDRNLTVHLILDFSASMNFGTKIKKYEYASMIGLGFASLALKNNEKFVLATFDDTLDFFKPKKGVRQIASILQYLNTKKAAGVSSFERSLMSYKQLVGTRSLIVIISDFFYDLEQIKNILYRYKKSQIILVQVLDDLEKHLKLEGDFNLKDLESNSQLHTYIDPYLRNSYLEELKVHQNKIKDLCTQVRAEFYPVSTDENIFDVFYRILH